MLILLTHATVPYNRVIPPEQNAGKLCFEQDTPSDRIYGNFLWNLGTISEQASRKAS